MGNAEHRDLEKRTQFSRRGFLRTPAATVPAAAVAATGMSISATSAWAQAAKNLKPHTMATLAKVARDIYPHDRLADVYYMTAVGSYDSADASIRDLIEQGIAALDATSMAKHGTVYLEVNWEDDRVAMLRGMQDGAFFKKLRGDLVVGLTTSNRSGRSSATRARRPTRAAICIAASTISTGCRKAEEQRSWRILI